MRHVLMIDDSVMEAKLLARKVPTDVIVHWLPSIRKGKELLSVKIYKFELVVVDVVGTSMGDDFQEEIDSLGVENILVTSNVMAPLERKYKFVLKDNLEEAVNKALGGAPK